MKDLINEQSLSRHFCFVMSLYITYTLKTICVLVCTHCLIKMFCFIIFQMLHVAGF
jgi:hypothetical protein